jgi:hypothetical protein
LGRGTFWHFGSIRSDHRNIKVFLVKFFKLLLIFFIIGLSQFHLAHAITWDDTYKTVAEGHAASCCSTCDPQYCTYVYCNDDLTDSTPILATPNDQCLCNTSGGIKRYVLGAYVAPGAFTAASISDDCLKGIYSSHTDLVASTAYTVPAAYDYIFDIVCLNDQDTAETEVGLGIGSFYCEGEETSAVRRYHYVEDGASASTNYYNQIYYCSNLSKDYSWKVANTNQVGAMCGGAGSQLGRASIDYRGLLADGTGGQYTATPTYTATNTPTAIPTTSTATPTATATNTATNTGTATATATPTNTATATNSPTAGCTEEDGAPTGNHNIFIAESTDGGTTPASSFIRDNGKNLTTFNKLCGLAASSAGLTKRYVALVANAASGGAKAQIESIAGFNSTGGYYNFSNQLATSWANFWSGLPLSNSITQNESDVEYREGVPITGSIEDGTLDHNCNNWSSTSGTDSFTVGDAASLDSWAGIDRKACNTNVVDQTVYCISLVPACTAEPAATATPTATNTPINTNTATETPTATNTPAGCTTEDGVASGNHNIFVVSGTMLGSPVGTLLYSIAGGSAVFGGRYGWGYDHFSYVCETKATEAGLTKRYVPMVVNNSGAGAKAAVEAHASWDNTGGIYNFATQISNSWANLWGGSLAAAIQKNQAGSNVSVYPITGSDFMGTNLSRDCNLWTNSTSSYRYIYGDSTSTGTGAISTAQIDCNAAPSSDTTLLSLYCISLKPACTADAAATATASPSPTVANTNTATATATATATTPGPTSTATGTATATATGTATATATYTSRPTDTATATGTATATATPTAGACIANGQVKTKEAECCSGCGKDDTKIVKDGGFSIISSAFAGTIRSVICCDCSSIGCSPAKGGSGYEFTGELGL